MVLFLIIDFRFEGESVFFVFGMEVSLVLILGFGDFSWIFVGGDEFFGYAIVG